MPSIYFKILLSSILIQASYSNFAEAEPSISLKELNQRANNAVGESLRANPSRCIVKYDINSSSQTETQAHAPTPKEIDELLKEVKAGADIKTITPRQKDRNTRVTTERTIAKLIYRDGRVQGEEVLFDLRQSAEGILDLGRNMLYVMRTFSDRACPEVQSKALEAEEYVVPVPARNSVRTST